MTAVIIEDEIPAGKRLEKILMKKDYIVLAILPSVVSALKWFEGNSQPDLVFMDIKLRDGNCFRILDKIQIQSKIVFTTAYDEFALKAFNYNAIDYLLKPIDESKLDKMISKYNAFKTGFTNALNWKVLEENIENKFKTSFIVSAGNHIIKIESHEVICFFSDINATFILTNQNRQFVINNSLDSLEQQLQPKSFFRINRKYLVNKKYISALKNEGQMLLQIPEAKEFDFVVSRLRIKTFLEWYKA
ncbi:LytR/AlgR family response regulator transcription factor [Flavobacterium granuli]|uniref:LytTR family two component transcriptional regulator n=1 Tax=Flavobacterium granuli TaxID=280093 RepID=A0A1M5TPN3_9FLAO|nr:LytTR family DNA-binding domain-containing protein [Flavobacterium granuli]PRZ19823.1 LytTR family two component transcriptional regulator [Flavobacterium granuli]SHH52630.1 two component transcriptional regulator, LytTR family [Flavobacterium granuli]